MRNDNEGVGDRWECHATAERECCKLRQASIRSNRERFVVEPHRGARGIRRGHAIEVDGSARDLELQRATAAEVQRDERDGAGRPVACAQAVQSKIRVRWCVAEREHAATGEPVPQDRRLVAAPRGAKAILLETPDTPHHAASATPSGGSTLLAMRASGQRSRRKRPLRTERFQLWESGSELAPNLGK